MPAPRPRHARATPNQKLPVARAMPAPHPRHCPVPPGVTGQWRGRGAGYRLFLGLGGAGVARAWRGCGAGMSCSPSPAQGAPTV
eukprot:gene13831-biopygen20067